MTLSTQVLRRIAIEALRSGTIASVVMMPFGFFFKWLGLFDPAGEERRAERLVGEFGPDTLLQRLPQGGRS